MKFILGDELESLLSCKRCEKVYDEAKLIQPCMKTLCDKCVSELTTGDDFECFFCQEEHTVPAGGFIANATIEELLRLRRDKVHRNNILIEELEEKLDRMKSLFDTFNSEALGLELSLDKHCSLVKNQIDLISEKKIEEIKQIRENYTKRVDEYKSQCLKNINDNKQKIDDKQTEVETNIEQYIDESSQFLRGFKLFDEAIKRQSEKTDSKIDLLLNELNDLEFVKFNGNKMTFESNQAKVEEAQIGKFNSTKLQSNQIKKLTSV